jgi:RNA processing factor Prp31
MSTLKEMEAQVLKVKERSRERLKIINQLTEENKELRIQNKFLVDRLEVWAERNFEERQRSLNMTVDEVVEQSKHKQDFKKEQELAKTVDEVKERLKNLDGQGIGKKE